MSLDDIALSQIQPQPCSVVPMQLLLQLHGQFKEHQDYCSTKEALSALLGDANAQKCRSYNAVLFQLANISSSGEKKLSPCHVYCSTVSPPISTSFLSSSSACFARNSSKVSVPLSGIYCPIPVELLPREGRRSRFVDIIGLY